MDSITVADIIAVMEQIAPTHLAEDWDNVGLQLGSEAWPVKKIWVALDPLSAVLEKACQKNVDLLITHHPLFFSPLKALDFGTKIGRCIEACICGRLSVYSAHTNLDSVAGGVNDIFADRIGLSNRSVLEQSKVLRNLDPPNSDDVIALDAALSRQSEVCQGIGRIGSLQHPQALKELALYIKNRLNLKSIRMVGDPALPVTRVAVCTGSGASLLKKFLNSDAQVYVSGDIKYHDATTVLEAGKAVIDVGHFASEQIMIDVVAERLEKWAAAAALSSITVEACHLECDPFTVLV